MDRIDEPSADPTRVVDADVTVPQPPGIPDPGMPDPGVPDPGEPTPLPDPGQPTPVPDPGQPAPMLEPTDPNAPRMGGSSADDPFPRLPA